METTTVRVSTDTRDRAAAIAKATGHSMASVMEAAVEVYHRELFWRDLRDAVARTRADEDAWAAVVAERAEWDETIGDGIEEERADHAPSPAAGDLR